MFKHQSLGIKRLFVSGYHGEGECSGSGPHEHPGEATLLDPVVAMATASKVVSPGSCLLLNVEDAVSS